MAAGCLKGVRWLLLALLSLGPMLPQDHLLRFLFRQQSLLFANVLVFLSGLATHQRYRRERRLTVYFWQRVGKLVMLAVPIVLLGALCVWVRYGRLAVTVTDAAHRSLWYDLWLLTPLPAAVGLAPNADVVSPVQPLLALSYTLVFLWILYPCVQRLLAGLHARKLLHVSSVFGLTLMSLSTSWLVVKLTAKWGATWSQQDSAEFYGTLGWFNHLTYKLPIFLVGVFTYEAAWLTSRCVPLRSADEAIGRRQVLQSYSSEMTTSTQSTLNRGVQALNDYLQECVVILKDAPVITSIFVDAIFAFGVVGTLLYDPTRHEQLLLALPIKGFLRPIDWVIASSTIILVPLGIWSFLVLSVFSDLSRSAHSDEVDVPKSRPQEELPSSGWLAFVPYNRRKPYSWRILRCEPFTSVLEGRSDVLYALLYRVILCGLYTEKARKETERQGHGFLLYALVCLLICHSLAAYVVAPLEVLFHVQLNKWYATDEEDQAKTVCLTTLRELKQGHNCDARELPSLIAAAYHSASVF